MEKQLIEKIGNSMFLVVVVGGLFWLGWPKNEDIVIGFLAFVVAFGWLLYHAEIREKKRK